MKKQGKKLNVYDVSKRCVAHEHAIKSLKTNLRKEQKLVNNYVILNVERENKIAQLQKFFDTAADFLTGDCSKRDLADALVEYNMWLRAT